MIKNILNFRVILLIILSIIGSCYYIYESEKSYNCLSLHAGNAVISLVYPSTFIDESYDDRIRIAGSGSDSEYILGVDPINYYQSVEEIVGNSLLEPGPKYEKINFNDYEAGFYHSDQPSAMDQYVIPFADRSFYLFFQDYFLSDNEKVLAKKILDSITMTKGIEYTGSPYVENCDN